MSKKGKLGLLVASATLATLAHKGIRKVKISKKGSVITIQKPVRVHSLRELALTETGMSLEDYVKENPYDSSCYIEFGRVGSEEL